MKSQLEPGGINLFQEIKATCLLAESQGKKIYRLSIGQPSGPALISARRFAAEAVMSDSESMHEYQDNGSPGVPDFAKKFIQLHFSDISFDGKNVSYLPTPGNKPMIGMVILSCNLQRGDVVSTVTNPGYPTPKDQAAYLKIPQQSMRTDPENSFLFSPEDIHPLTRLIMTNYPHNPSGQIATTEWWNSLCSFCEKHEIRLFNDNPYYVLSHSLESSALAEVAPNYDNLSWAEAFSASKIIGNGTGWRIGAMIGSPDFIGDIATIKSNTDSGFVAPMAAGVLHAMETDKVNIESSRRKYEQRIELLINIMTKHGMQLAVKPQAGFFTLWKTPKVAFGQIIESAKQFNYLMIQETGIVGVHFEPYIRYAVTGDIESIKDVINEAFSSADVSY